MQAFDTFQGRAAGHHRQSCTRCELGISRQRRAETRVVTCYYPDTLVGTDSHTTMINGPGHRGLGRRPAIEARRAGNAWPAGIFSSRRDVVGVHMTGFHPRRAGDRHGTWRSPSPRILRKAKVVGKFVEIGFRPPARAALPLVGFGANHRETWHPNTAPRWAFFPDRPPSA